MRALQRLAEPFIRQDSKEATDAVRGPFRWIWRFYSWRLTHAGRCLMWPTVGFLAYTSASLNYQAYVPLVYILSLWFVALAISLIIKPRTEVSISHFDRIAAGETLPIDFEVKRIRAWNRDLFVTAHCLPPDIDVQPFDGTAVPVAASGQSVKATLGLHCPKRGVYRVPGYRIESDFPFGIVRSFQTIEHESRIVVCPRYRPLSRFELPTGRRYQPGGVALAADMGDATDFIGNREFRDGDNIRNVDWRSTARLGQPIVREYREEYFLRVAIILDTHIPKDPAWSLRSSRESRQQALENAISLTASIGDYLSHKEYVVDIFAAGPNLYHLMAGRGLAYMDQILDILACVEDTPTEPFSVIEPELMFNLSRISTIICVFIEWNEARRQFVKRLREQGVGLKIIIVSNDISAATTFEDDVRVISDKDLAAGIDEL